jgi:8-oxo-dGTP pyrophosphatase MutT (NUDIX family)
MSRTIAWAWLTAHGSHMSAFPGAITQETTDISPALEKQLTERRMMIDTVAWVHLENGRILCARPRGKGVFYVPGGKREGAESDLQTLLREVAEELTVALRPETVRHAGTYQADHPDGTAVRMSCYTGEYSGTLAASSEIDELAWFGYADRTRVPPVDQLLFDDLNAAGQLR